MDMRATRVVVTGMGAVTPLGNDVATTWQRIVSGESGISRITLFDPEGFETQIAGEVRGFDPSQYLSPKEARRLDRVLQFAVAATEQALRDADLTINANNAEQVAVLVSSGIGGLMTLSEQFKVLFEKGPRRISPFLIPMMIIDMVAGQVSIHTGAKGPNFSLVSACATGATSIGEGAELIRRGDARIAIVGGAEASITPIGIAGFNAMNALSTRNDEPTKASRPFDALRDGFVMAEGAGVLILEDLEHALQRGARIYAEVLGYGATGDASHITQPAEGGEGVARAIRMAMRKAGVSPQDIHYINAHGTSTPLNEKYETMAIKSALGDYAYRVPVSSTKSMTGHMLGAAGAVEAIFCIQAIQTGIIPPTINYEFPDPDCDLDYVPNVARQARVDIAVSNAMGFGGHNAVLILGRFVA
jgi:3-oxoacyl-[acyl-carrier-protein] synthase II